MKKRRNTPQADAAAEAGASAVSIDPGTTVPVSEIAGEMPDIAVAKLAVSEAPSIQSPGAQPRLEPAPAETPHARNEPVLPRAATLGASPSSAARAEAPGRTPPARAAAATDNVPRPRRFALLAISLAFSASLGALGGSLAVPGVAHLLAPAPPPAAADVSEEIRALKDSLGQLRGNVKTLGDNLAGVRAALNASFSSSTAQFAKIAEAIEKLDRRQAERHAAAQSAPPLPAAAPAPPAAPDVTGSTAAGASGKSAKPGVVEGWVLRKAYRGAALVEGRYGIIEIEPGDTLPGVGRVEEIKRQDGRWVVVTGKGLIVGAQ